MLQLLLKRNKIFSHKHTLIYVNMKYHYADGLTTQFYTIAYFILDMASCYLKLFWLTNKTVQKVPSSKKV